MNNNNFHNTLIPKITTVLKHEIDKFTLDDMGGGYKAYSIKHPSKELSLAAQAAIYDAYVPLTTYAFGADMTLYWRARKEEQYMERAEELVLVVDKNDDLVGWTSYSLVKADKSTIVYNDSSGITPPHQKNKLMGRLFQKRVSDCIAEYADKNIPLLFATRTETPVMYSMQKKLTDTLYPSPDYPTPDFISDQALIMADWLGQKDKLDKKSLIIRNAYAMLDELYGELPSSGDDVLDHWIRHELGPLDAFLLIGVGN